jgi:uncharacterized FlaG/YvyC family protein|tara:strand:+ start:465 stop:743 length:279 start_codon:yes stop_codon:yes gene_type:complete
MVHLERLGFSPIHNERFCSEIKLTTNKMKPTLQGFLIDDLKKVEHHVNEIIENIYARGQKEDFAEDIEQIDEFFSYWNQHAQFEKETELKNQ